MPALFRESRAAGSCSSQAPLMMTPSTFLAIRSSMSEFSLAASPLASVLMISTLG